MAIEGIGAMILTYRQRENLSLSKLAERTGVSKTSLSKIETGATRHPSFQLWKKVGHTLHIPFDEIIGHYLDTTERPATIKLLLEESIALNNKMLIQKAAQKLLETTRMDSLLALDHLLQVTKGIDAQRTKLTLYGVIIDYTRKSGIPYFLSKSIYERYILERDDFARFEETYWRGKELLSYIDFLQPTERVDYYYRMGVHAYILEYYGESIELCRKGIHEDQTDNKSRASALISTVNSYLRLGDLILAEFFLEMYERSQYADFRKKHLRALLYAKKGDCDQAIALYNDCLHEAKPDGRITIVSDLLEVCLETGRNDAIQELIGSEDTFLPVDCHPNRLKHAARYFKRKSACLLAMGQIDDGIDSLIQSIRFYRQIGAVEKTIQCFGLLLRYHRVSERNFSFEDMEIIEKICNNHVINE
ncbi:helix-turn-helix domain-containing protein [Brevibacillus borstelensis]|uniref:helix-turn-helix domain-containing protein n=1 Tax=Brevibacillus borstelensis TaxID=45462 RepID=UPI0030BAEC65